MVRVSLQVYADVGPLLERVPESQRKALWAMAIGWQGCDGSEVTDAALKKTLVGLTERVFAGSDYLRLSSPIYRQTYQVRGCSLHVELVLLASVVPLGSQPQDSRLACAALDVDKLAMPVSNMCVQHLATRLQRCSCTSAETNQKSAHAS